MSTLSFNSVTAAGGENESCVAKRGKRRAAEWPYPIGRASMGRLCALFLQLLAPLSPELYKATHIALQAYLMNPDYVPCEPVDENVYRLGCEEIDRCVRRSRLARERAAERKKAKTAEKTGQVETTPATTENNLTEQTPSAPVSSMNNESAPSSSSNAKPAPSPAQRVETGSRAEPIRSEGRSLADWPVRRRVRYPFEADCY